MEWSIQEIAKLAGTTSRTLRHYDSIGLLAPTRIGKNGYRYYDAQALTRLQRILLLRELGLGLPAIAEVLEGHRDHVTALGRHLEWLRREQERLRDQIRSVEGTIKKLEQGEEPMAKEMFKGFDPSQYREEVTERWGKASYDSGNRWWQGMTEEARTAWTARTRELSAAWAEAARRGVDPEGDEAQALAQRHFDWLAGVPGTPRSGDGPSREYWLGLAEMYVSDERFAVNYGGVEGATFVRDTMKAFAKGMAG